MKMPLNTDPGSSLALVVVTGPRSVPKGSSNRASREAETITSTTRLPYRTEYHKPHTQRDKVT